jgi:hypothetical protein
MERLHTTGQLTSNDLSRIYSGAYLGYYTYLERAIERAFLGYLMGRYSSSDKRVKPLVQIKSEAVAQKVITGGRSYADWIPYRMTAERAEAFLSAGRPFADLPKADRKVLDDLSTMRNAIAHESAYSIRRFRETFTAGKSLRPAELVPPGYLRGTHALGQTRLNFLFSEGVRIMGRLLA